MTRRPQQVRLAGLLPMIVGLISACGSATTSGCSTGPCDTTGSNALQPAITGFPSDLAFASVGRLARGDSVTLYAIRMRVGDDPCVAPDTLRANVQWGVSNSAAAAITPLPDGGVRVRALAQGLFQMLMREGGGIPSTAVDTKIVYTCPAGLPITTIGVTP